ncbi:MAG TPA: FAD-binding oxidoreductase [Gemmatimonadota bacterium]|nr:FAD-binding oxidoreductase [Gemmatimonadota bacterium]
MIGTTSSHGPGAPLDENALEALSAELRGPVIRPSDPDYDDARALYNAMIDKHPGAIARCLDVADVAACVDFARENGVLLAIRGGGHNGPGLGSCDGGLVADLSRMRGVRVDPDARTVRVAAGCQWGDVDHATHAFGLATVSGVVSTTGVAGLTLGGGHGYLSRRHGLTIDNLLSADVVLADGSFVRASEDENPDLFWALRGGGGNFGVVTSFLFRLHEVRNVVGGPTLWDIDDAEEVLRWWDGFMAGAPEELSGFFAFLTVPPGPPFPEELHLRMMCGIVWCWSGDEADAEDVFAPVAAFGPPALNGIGTVPYPAIQGAFDALYPKGLQWYWKGDFFRTLSGDAVAAHVEHGTALPTMLSGMHLYPIDGAVQRVGATETAWGHRDVRYSQVIIGVDTDPANADVIRDWARGYHDALHPYSAGAGYLNFMMEEGQEPIAASYGPNYERLRRVKAHYDPGNLFRVNHNIPPAA